ncbi:amidinotransferase [Spongiactinospora rosea]|uniref:Amidinotransferase n=1 Tax=Spongiactinospora rosea TaxID=2248750 RepID=A0A366M1N4_9ACTN|nr:dimethylargininase [Spongiactinospora rosea]RBQ19947.1 amidinotransferase [Spongiactinospora rosea]
MSVPRRHYLMCRPDYFAVEYRINPWMDPSRGADRDLALRQWEDLKSVYEDLGHTVEVIEPVAGLPDMVFAANGALVVDSRVYGARFAHPERAEEAGAYLRWFTEHGFTEVKAPSFTNEGEGDLLVVDDLVLAGTGFRTDVAAHREVQEFTGHPVITLGLADPRYYHLDTALCPLGGRDIAYLPQAFTPGGRAVLERLFPDALIATPADAAAFGLNSVCDGKHVIINHEAADLQLELKRRGYEVIPVHTSELRKAGGGPKCCTLEIRK